MTNESGNSELAFAIKVIGESRIIRFSLFWRVGVCVWQNLSPVDHGQSSEKSDDI